MDPLGKSTSIVEMQDGSLSNGFNSIGVNDIDSVIPSSSVRPNQVGTGAMRGNQRISNADGSTVEIGTLPNGLGVGIFSRDDQERIQSVWALIPSLAPYIVEIDAIYGYDVLKDILGIM